MPFGGAGPLFGTLLARELEIREIVVPPYAGNFSAWGLLGADLTQSPRAPTSCAWTTTRSAESNRILGELFAESRRAPASAAASSGRSGSTCATPGRSTP